MNQQILLTIPLDEFKTIQKNWIKEVLTEIDQETSSAKTDLPELLSAKQTANFLGISKVTLWKWSQQGKLVSYQISGRIRYKRDEILQAIKGVKNLKYRREDK